MKVKFYYLLFLMAVIFIIVGCEQKETSVIDSETEGGIRTFTYVTDEVSQQFTIVPAYGGFDEYIRKVREDQDANKRAVFNDTVIIPVWDACFRGGEYLELMMPYFNGVEGFENVDQLEKQIHKMKSANLEKYIEEALLKSAELLPGPDTTVCILPALSTVHASGINVGAGKITIFYDDRHTGSGAELGGLVAHEYHHSVWTDRHYEGQPFYLLNYLVFEGRAEAFKHMLYPNSWRPLYSSDDEENYWSQIQDSLSRDAYNPQFNQTVMFGGNGFPANFGYALGFEIVQDFLKNNPDVTVGEWTALSPEELFEKSRFVERFN